MTENRGNDLPTVVVMTIATISVTLGDLMMSKAMRMLGPLTLPSLNDWWYGDASVSVRIVLYEIYQLLWSIFSQPTVWLAILFMLVFLVLWMIALSWSDLTFVMPLTALTYVLNALLVGPFLGEEVTSLRWLGTIAIAAGVAIVTLERSSPEKS